MKELVEAENLLWQVKFRNDTNYGEGNWEWVDGVNELYEAVLLLVTATQKLESIIVGEE